MMMRAVLLAAALVGCHPDMPPSKPLPPLQPVAIASDAPVARDAPDPADAGDAGDGEWHGIPDEIQTRAYHAMGGKWPPMPAISADGKHVALYLGYGAGTGAWHTHEWAIYGPGDKREELISLVSAETVDAVYKGDASKLPSAATLAATVAQLRARLAGFTPIAPAKGVEKELVPEEKYQTTFSAGVLVATKQPDGSKNLVWTPKTGTPTKIEPVPGRCGPARFAGSWFDEAHGRLVIELEFTGTDSCPDDPPEWHVL
jgi:hypothetical protein